MPVHPLSALPPSRFPHLAGARCLVALVLLLGVGRIAAAEPAAGGATPPPPAEGAATTPRPAAGTVYLTFDDGPIDATLGILEVLERHGVKATFFVNGFHLYGEGDEQEGRAREALLRMLGAGHLLGNHSYDHLLHNCCDGEQCGAAACNRVARWNVGAYRSLEVELESFLPTNVDRTRAVFPAGASFATDRLDSLARLPYTNAWRVGGLRADCPCCTADDVPPWDPKFVCSPAAPTRSAQVAIAVADALAARGVAVYGWDLEWSPRSWGDADPVSTLSDGDELAAAVSAAMAGCTATTMEPAHSRAADFPCDDPRRAGKVVVLAHDFLFEDGRRGRGATHNLPKLDRFLTVMRERGYRFATLDRYLD